MENSINPQAKDEVRELLSELIVSPVSIDVGEKITKVINLLSKLQEASKQFNIIKGIVESKAGILSKAFDNSFEEVSSSINECVEKCKKIKIKTDKLDDIQSEMIEALSSLNESLNKSNTTIEELIQNIGKSLSEDFGIKFTEVISEIKTCQSVCEEIKLQILEEIQKNCNDVKSVSSKLDELKTILLNSDERVGNIGKDIPNQIQSVSQNIANGVHGLTDTLGEISISIENNKSEAYEEHNRQYKQNKTSFLIIIVLSVINLLGLIGLIMIHVIH